MIRIGLVGAGPWAQMYHAPMLARAPEVEFAGVWARRREAADPLAAEHGVTSYAEYEDLLVDCDAVAFAVPPDVQARLGVQAAQAGKHLLLEKPIATTLEDAQALADAAAEAGVASVVVLRYHFGRPAQEFLAAVRASTVRTVTAWFVSNSALEGSVFATPWRVAAPHALLDLGPHALDLVEAAAGPVETVTAALSGDVLTMLTRHGDGAVGTVVVSAATPGTDGPLGATAITDTGRYELADPEAEPREDVQATIVTQFARAVAGEPTLGLDVQRGLALQRLLAAVEESLDTGAPVDLAR